MAAKAAKFDVNKLKEKSKQPLKDIFGEEIGAELSSPPGNTPNKKAMALAEDLDITLLCESPENPFKVKDDDEMAVLAASIKKEGILNPILARPKGDGTFEIISGHRRKFAAKKIGLTKLPVIVREMSDYDARRIMVDLNLNREHISPSEKANAIALKYFAIKRTPGAKGKRRAYELMDEEPHDSAQEIANEMGMTARTIRKYVTLSSLSDELLQKVDDGKLGISVAEQVAYMSDQAAAAVNAYLEKGNSLSMDEARLLRDALKGTETVTAEDVEKALRKKARKNSPKRMKTVLKGFSKELASGNLIPPATEKDKEEVLKNINNIRKALEEYESRLNK